MQIMRKTFIQFLHRIGLYQPVRWLYTRCVSYSWRAYSFLTGRDRAIVQTYLTRHDVRKLHLGCGLNYLSGWLNTDLFPNEHRVHLNVTKRFPYPDNTFDFIYSEHMIEHLLFAAGRNMLSECFRVLKPNGVMRLVTPDFRFLLNLYLDPDKPLHRDYIEWNSDLFVKDEAPHNALSVINNYVRDWGHQYIYDVPILRKTLSAIGFRDIEERLLGESLHSDLQKLEHESRHPAGFLALESLVLEAKKV